MSGSISSEEFLSISGVVSGQAVVALSGGPDSMALAWLLARSGASAIHALIVDHGMRDGSAAEASGVGGWCRDILTIDHTILTLPALPRGMAEARRFRYAALAQACAARGIGTLFLAHHQDDQAETFLFRLAKGSGLDGLGAMRPRQAYDARLMLLRPLLTLSKARLVATCEAHGLPFVRDPGNSDPAFARARLRAAEEALGREGLSPKRLATTAMRLRRAGAALDHYAEALHAAALRPGPAATQHFDLDMLAAAPEETRLRVLQRAIGGGQAVRRERLEALAADLFAAAPFRRRTLGGHIVSRDDRRRLVIVVREGISDAKAGLPSPARSSILREGVETPRTDAAKG